MSSPRSDRHSDILDLLVLTRIKGLGPARIGALLRKAQTPEAIFRFSRHDLISTPGIGATLAESIASELRNHPQTSRLRDEAARMLDKLPAQGITIVTLLDPSYPPLLREIYDPPPCLFIRGNLECANATTLAVVGTRNATAYGKKATDRITTQLASAGVTIVSGLAYGIDTAAHHATLQTGGTTIAVLAGGVDNPYTDPKGKLWPRIAEHGALVSEEWPGTPIAPNLFPKRNRIISGLSQGTLIVESHNKGGSLITAASAIEQNREVFAIPGPIFSRSSEGPNNLIERGQAKLVTSAGSILAELMPSLIQPTLFAEPAPHQPQKTPLSKQEQLILTALQEGPLHIDIIAQQTNIPSPELLVILFDMELQHQVEQHPGQIFTSSG